MDKKLILLAKQLHKMGLVKEAQKTRSIVVDPMTAAVALGLLPGHVLEVLKEDEAEEDEVIEELLRSVQEEQREEEDIV